MLIHGSFAAVYEAYDLNNNEIGSDLTSISTQGITITLLGTATDGDEITISPSNNFSKDLL